jgi:hypothetical protein
MGAPQSSAASWVFGGLLAMGTVVVLIAFLALTHGGLLRYQRLVQGGATTQGIIVRTEMSNHCLVEYFFIVGAKRYSTITNICSVSKGQKVDVTYLISDPNISCIGSASEGFKVQLISYVIGGIALVILDLFVFTIWRRKQMRA